MGYTATTDNAKDLPQYDTGCSIGCKVLNFDPGERERVTLEGSV